MSGTPPNTLTPPASDSRANSPSGSAPAPRAVSGSLKDRIAKFNNPSAAPLIPTHAFGTAGPNQPSSTASRGLVGNRIPSFNSGPSFVSGGRKVSENKGMIGNRLPSVAGKAPRSASPAGSVDSSTASASGPAGSSASPITSRSSSPPSSPTERDHLNLLRSTLPGPRATTPSSTRAEADETPLSIPNTPIQQPHIPNEADPAQYDLVLPNLKLIAEESKLGGSLAGSSKASQFAEEGGSETQQQKMLQDVSGVSTPMGTPRAERRELEGSTRGEGSVGDEERDMEEVTDRLAGLGQGEEELASDATEIAEDPTGANDLADLKAGKLNRPDTTTMDTDHENPVNSVVESSFIQQLDEQIVAPDQEIVQGVEVGKREGDAEKSGDMGEKREDGSGVEEPAESEILHTDNNGIIEVDPSSAGQHDDPSKGPEEWEASKDHVGERGPDHEDEAQKRSKESGQELAENETSGQYDSTGRTAGDNVDEGPAFQGNVLGATGHTEHGPGEASFAEKMVDFHVAHADEPTAQAGLGKLQPDVGEGDQPRLGQEEKKKLAEEPARVSSPEPIPQPSEKVGSPKPPPISRLNFTNPTIVEFHATKREPEIGPGTEDRKIADSILDGGVSTNGFRDVEGVTEDDKIDSGQGKDNFAVDDEVEEQDEKEVDQGAGTDADKPVQLNIEPAPIAQPAGERAPTQAEKDVLADRDTSEPDPPSFPTPPTQDPDLETPHSAISPPATTTLDATFLKSFPDVPSDAKPRVQVHVSSSPITTPQKPAATQSSDTPIANLPGHSKSLSLNNFNMDYQSSDAGRRGSLEEEGTRPFGIAGGSKSAGNLVKRGSTRRSPKSPLLDDEDPGDFEAGEGWAVVTKGRDN